MGHLPCKKPFVTLVLGLLALGSQYDTSTWYLDMSKLSDSKNFIIVFFSKFLFLREGYSDHGFLMTLFYICF